MKTIKTNLPLKTYLGEPMKNGTDDLTIGLVISSVLGGKVSNPTLGWQLGKKFATEKEVDLKAEEVLFIKKELEMNAQSKEMGFNAIVIGQIIDLLEGKDEPEAPKKK